MRIILVSNKKINRKKYDACIENSPFGTIYALSWYLDVVSPGWKLLTTKDYTTVMPLPLKKKAGISYISQPDLCQQLGIFSIFSLTQNIFDSFMKKLKFVPYYFLQMNFGNTFFFRDQFQKTNYILDMNLPYETLREQYNRNTMSDLSKADRNELHRKKIRNILPYMDQMKTYFQHYEGKKFQTLKKLATKAEAKGMLHAYIAYDKDLKEVLALVGFFQFKNRFYYLIPASSSSGKKLGAMRFLIDRFIREHANSDTILDFEGSSLPSVAQFYRGFAPVSEPYIQYRKNWLVISPFRRNLTHFLNKSSLY